MKYIIKPNLSQKYITITYKKHGEVVCNTEVVVDKEVKVVEVTKKNLGSLKNLLDKISTHLYFI